MRAARAPPERPIVRVVGLAAAPGEHDRVEAEDDRDAAELVDWTSVTFTE